MYTVTTKNSLINNKSIIAVRNKKIAGAVDLQNPEQVNEKTSPYTHLN